MRRLCFVGMAMIGIIHAAGASELDAPRLRGSTVSSVAPTHAARPSPYVPATLPPAYPAAPAPPVAVAAPPAESGSFRFKVGTRYWLSSGKLAKDLFNDPRVDGVLNSRLTYDGLEGGSFEGFGRVDASFGTFVKGNIGFAGLGSGALKDEDFPPALTPYSSTLSQQGGGRLSYASIDVGQIAVTSERVRGSFFAGYGHLSESANANGCNQTAGNPFVCVPAISSGILAITEDTHWDFVRLGFLGEIGLLDRLKLSAEVAWLPYAQVDARDTHWLRLGSTPGSIAGPIPESGNGSGVQIETILSYQVTDRIGLGIGGRYWLLQTRGSTGFENVIVGFPQPVAQPLNFVTTRYGAFAQGEYRFGPF